MFPLSEGMKIKACYQIFKKEALTGSQFLGGGGVAEKEGVTFFRLGDYSFFIKSKLKSEIFNGKILILWGFTEKSDF